MPSPRGRRNGQPPPPTLGPDRAPADPRPPHRLRQRRHLVDGGRCQDAFTFDEAFVWSFASTGDPPQRDHRCRWRRRFEHPPSPAFRRHRRASGEEVVRPHHRRNHGGQPDFLAPRLAKFEIPRYFIFAEEPLPRTASGKILKRSCGPSINREGAIKVDRRDRFNRMGPLTHHEQRKALNQRKTPGGVR